jgi:uncharacterized protein HemX
VSDTDSSRPRLVSIANDPPDHPAQGPGEAPAAETGPSGRRTIGLLVALLIAAVLGLVTQGVRLQALQRKNSELSGELFTARTALEAYVARFTEVRESIGGLQEKIDELEALVSADPLEPEVQAPQEAAGADPQE